MVSVTVDSELDSVLEEIARREGRSKTEVVRQALQRFVDEHAQEREARREAALVRGEDDREAAELCESLFDWDAE